MEKMIFEPTNPDQFQASVSHYWHRYLKEGWKKPDLIYILNSEKRGLEIQTANSSGTVAVLLNEIEYNPVVAGNVYPYILSYEQVGRIVKAFEPFKKDPPDQHTNYMFLKEAYDNKLEVSLQIILDNEQLS